MLLPSSRRVPRKYRIDIFRFSRPELIVSGLNRQKFLASSTREAPGAHTRQPTAGARRLQWTSQA